MCFGELLEDGQYERESISDLLPPPLSVLAEPEQTFRYTIGRLPALDVAGKAIAGHSSDLQFGSGFNERFGEHVPADYSGWHGKVHMLQRPLACIQHVVKGGRGIHSA